jgi:thermitase
MRRAPVLALTLLLIGTLTFAFDTKIVKPEYPVRFSGDEPQDFSSVQKPLTLARASDGLASSEKLWSEPTVGSLLENGLDARLGNTFRVPFESGGNLNWQDETNPAYLVHVQGNLAELVVGLDKVQSNSYSELLDVIAGDGGRLVNKVSMGGRVAAVVADVPLEAVSAFVSEVEVSGLSRYVEPDVRFQVDFTPNDAQWSLQWGPQKIGADWAWNTTAGSSSVIVAVVDTGVDYTHPDLAANYVPLGYDWVNNDADPMDDFGHGTHVAGIIAAVINNSLGIAGLAQVRIMAEKVLDSNGEGMVSDIAEGIVHAVDHGARIINLSLGSNVNSNLLHEAVRYAYDHGVLVVAAAGNDATDQEHYPAAYDEVVAVSATDKLDNPANFTDYGSWVDVAAPGVNVYSTMPTHRVTMNDEGFNLNYDYLSGTSMACPHAVGVAALIWSRFPGMTRDQVWAQLQYSADDLGKPGFDVYYGFGRINARKAVENAPTNHDTLVLNLRTPSHVSPGQVAVINTTVLNMGNSDESDIIVRLLVNGSMADSSTINFLMSGRSIAVSFSWSGANEGVYNVTSYVVPVMGETVLGNNALSKNVEVRLPRVIRVPNDYGSIQQAIGAAKEGDTISVAPGVYYGSMRIDKEGLTLEGESRNSTIIDGGRNVDVVSITADNVKIDNFTIRHSGNYVYGGIYVLGSDGDTISNTTVSNNFFGIFIESSRAATMRDNNMTGNVYNFGVDGDSLVDFTHDIDTSNTVDGKPVYYWVNERDRQVPLDAGCVAIVNSTGIVAKDLNLTKNYAGVVFAFTTDSLMENVNASGNYFGAYLAYSQSCRVDGDNATSSIAGIYLYQSDGNSINNDTLVNNQYGIGLYSSNQNTVDSGKMLKNKFNLQVEKSDNNTVTDNEASGGTNGFILENSRYNTLRNNIMTGNVYNFGVDGDDLLHFIQDIDTSNTVNGKSVQYLVNRQGLSIDPSTFPETGYLGIINCSDINVLKLDLSNNVQGVLIAYTNGSTISNVDAMNNMWGVWMIGSSENAISQNNLAENSGSLGLWCSHDNTVFGNRVADGSDGIDLYYSDGNTVAVNTVTNTTVGIWVASSDNNTVSNNTASKNAVGIYLYWSEYNIVADNVVNAPAQLSDLAGTALTASRDNSLPLPPPIGTGAPSPCIGLTESGNNVIKRNAASGDKDIFGAGIYLEWSSDNNTITENVLLNNRFGIVMGYWSLYGLQDQDSNNTVFHNSLIGNTKQALCLDSVNTWDDGYPSGGNYWSDYAEADRFRGIYQNETGADGIGDASYVIGGNVTDRYPLMKPWPWPVLGDINFDHRVDMQDVMLALYSFGSFPGHPRWNPVADIDSDGTVTMSDIVVILRNFGQHYP